MKRLRWSAFGHMLKMNEDAPCQRAMCYYFEVPPGAKKYPGRQRTTLPTILNQDIKDCAKLQPLPLLKFETNDDLTTLRRIASDRTKWKQLSSAICNIVEDEE